MTKPRLVKVRALFYVLQQVTKEAVPILTQPPCQFFRSVIHAKITKEATALSFKVN